MLYYIELTLRSAFKELSTGASVTSEDEKTSDESMEK